MDINEKKNSYLVLDLVDTCIEAVTYVKSKFLNNDFPEGINMLKNVNEVVKKVEIFLNEHGQKSFIKESILYCKNIEYSCRKIIGEINRRSFNEAFYTLTCEVVPFIMELSRQLDFELKILPHPELWSDYRKKREEEIYNYSKKIESDEKKYLYEASICIKAYNKLEYTKMAIESIFKHIDFSSGRYELITINNGSTDETEEYFNSLPHTKKVNLRFNIPGTQVAKHIVEGKYGVGYSNDVIATHHWLENLIACMESDRKIVWAVPTCNSSGISNGQGIDIPYKNSIDSIKDIENFGRKYNSHNSSLWEERSILMPFVTIIRSSYHEECSGIDRLYTQLEFVDDDLSTSFRRAGLKQILAKDTFMHHFGSVTLGDGQRNHNSFGNMREVYYQKWGVDAWDSRCCLPGVERLLESSLPKQNPKLLFIEPRFGGGSLQIKNCLKKHGILPEQTVSMVVDQRYIEDAVHMYDETIRGNDIYQMLDKEERLFDIISIGCLLHDLITKDVIEFLENLYKRLTMHGKIIFLIKNYRSAKVIVDLLQNNMPGDCGYKNIGFTGIHSGRLIEMLEKHKFLNQCTVERIGKHTPEVDAILNMDSAFHTLPDSQKKVISDEFGTEMYMIMIEKVLS